MRSYSSRRPVSLLSILLSIRDAERTSSLRTAGAHAPVNVTATIKPIKAQTYCRRLNHVLKTAIETYLLLRFGYSIAGRGCGGAQLITGGAGPGSRPLDEQASTVHAFVTTAKTRNPLGSLLFDLQAWFTCNKQPPIT